MHTSPREAIVYLQAIPLPTLPSSRSPKEPEVFERCAPISKHLRCTADQIIQAKWALVAV